MKAGGGSRWDGWSSIRLRHLSLAVSGGIYGVAAAAILARDLRWTLPYGAMGTLLCALAGALGVVLPAMLLPGRDARRAPEGAWDALPFWLPALDLLLPGSSVWRGPVLWVGALLIWVLIRLERSPASRRLWLMLAVGLPLFVYLLDLSPYVGRADTFEFQVIGPQLGIAHPSGYPLYTLICWLFSLLPFGTVAWRINLSSAVFAALTAGFLFLALDTAAIGREARARVPAEQSMGEGTKRWGGGARAMRLAVVLTLAFSPTLWSRAVEAEVYSLNASLVALCLWLAVSWHLDVGWMPRSLFERKGKRLRLPANTTVADYTWPALGLLVGLALASHITLGALAFLAASALLLSGQRPSRRAWVLALAFGVLGILFYAYIPLRWPAVTGGEQMSPGQFWRFVTNAESGGALRVLAFYQDPARWSLVGRLLLLQVEWGGLLLAILGFLVLVWTLPALALGLTLAFAAWVWFGLSFYVAEPDYSAFFIPAHVLLVFLLGYGADALRSALVRLKRRVGALAGGRRRAAGGFLAQGLMQSLLVVVFLLPLSRFWITGPGLDTRSEGRTDEAWGRYVLGLPLAEGAAILADSVKFPPLYYLQQIEGLRPDLDLVTLFNEPQYRQSLEARLDAGQQVYLARYLPGMDEYGVSSTGPLVAVAPDTLTTGAERVGGVRFGEALALGEYELVADPVGRAMHHLTLVWHVREPVRDDLEIRLRLVLPGVEEGRVAWEVPARRPVGGYTTTEAWKAGWRVADYHALEWPPWLPSGVYELEVGVFPHFEAEGLTVAGGTEAWVSLGDVVVTAPVGEHLPNRHAVLIVPSSEQGSPAAALRLVGSRVPAEVAAASPLALDLAWICRGEVPDRIGPRLWWVNTHTGVETAQRLAAQGELGESLSCSGAGGVQVLRRYPLVAPDQPGRYRLEIGAWEGLGAAPASARCEWLGRIQERCPIASVEVRAAGAGLATYAGRILLLEAGIDAGRVPAGGPLHATMRWRGLEEMLHDYTVFVQVIGPEGQVYGQSDSWPRHGSRPTSGWRAGEEVEDLHSFYVRSGGPSGEYRVIAGLYLLADMTRLPVIDASGSAIADFYEVGSFRLP